MPSYGYSALEKGVRKLCRRQVTVFSIGRSVLNRHIYCIGLGCGAKKIFLNGAHHGLESITSHLLMRFAFSLLRRQRQRDAVVCNLLRKCTLYIVPMVNPDGVEIALNHLPHNPEKREFLLQHCGGQAFSKVWQANARGVDLNHNYDALWNHCQQLEKGHGIMGPGPTRYGGNKPESEPETQAVANLVRKIGFDLCIAFHSQGEVIYWDFNGMADERAKHLGEAMAESCGYELDKAEGIASCGGFKDWVVQEYGIPAYTVEVGLGKNPLPPGCIAAIYPVNERLLFTAMREICCNP